LCPNGGCTTYNDFQRCNTVTVPSRAIVTYAEATPASIAEFQTILAALNSDPEFVDLVMRGTNRQSYMFNADTIRLNPYNGTAQAYMEAAFEAYRSMQAMETDTALTAGAFSGQYPGLQLLPYISLLGRAVLLFLSLCERRKNVRAWGGWMSIDMQNWQQ
jgi:hypothetical protein